MSWCIRIRTQVRASGTAVRVVRHEWGVLSTAPAAFSHSEGRKILQYYEDCYYKTCSMEHDQGVRGEE